MATFLLEIGTEELPADFAREALRQLHEQVSADLERLRLTSTAVRCAGTPRRLALTIEGMAERQEDRTSERKGPPAQQAFREGQPTEAALGFARRCGVAPEQLEIRETEKGPFVFACSLERGQATVELLPSLIPTWLWALQGRRFMRWGTGESRFSRPVRWLVALLDAEVVPVELSECDPPVRSDRLSRGHRLQSGTVSIADAGVYAATLAAHDVQVDRTIRATWIREHLELAAAEAGGRADLPETLFEELVDLVEAPQLIEGAIEPRFLSLPPEVLSTVMRAHQRYVPLLRADAPADPLALEAGAVLLPRFLCVANGRAEAAAVIRRGNERVLRMPTSLCAPTARCRASIGATPWRGSPLRRGSAASVTAASASNGSPTCCWRPPAKKRRRRWPGGPPTSANTTWSARWWASFRSSRG